MPWQNTSTTIDPHVLTESVSGITVARFTGTALVDEVVISSVDEELQDLIGGVTDPALLLNFREVRLMSSTMLAVLLGFSRSVARRGGRLKPCAIAPDLLVSFRITRFDRLFEIHEDENAALDSFEYGRRKHDLIVPAL